jgi:uncharacterized membrane protein
MSIDLFPASAILGFASGLRSATGIAAFAHTVFADTPKADVAHGVAGLAIVGESVMDKLPSTPSRLKMPALLGRVVAGGLGAYGLARRAHPVEVEGRPRTAAIAVGIGSAAALAGSYAGAAYRSAAAKKVPPVVGALAEDVVANGLAYVAVVRSAR